MATRKKFYFGRLFLILSVLGLYALWALLRPLPFIQPVDAAMSIGSSAGTAVLNWPAGAQAAVGMTPSGVLAEQGEQRPVPIASNAKVLTAVAVLKKRPLQQGQTGPSIPITEADVALYNEYFARDGSIMPVEAGTPLTQYQMLQALMLPSANNVADSLAIWAFGSLDNYRAFANNLTRQLGMTNTRVGADASGLDAGTVSTAHDLVLLGQAAMREPVLAEIVNQRSAQLPVAGTVFNTNFLLGTDNIIGLKTGNTDEAGGVFMGASRFTAQGKQITMVSSIIGTPTLRDAMLATVPLLASAEDNFGTTTVLPAGAVVGHYAPPWGGRVDVVTAADLQVVAWKGSKLPINIALQPVTPSVRSGDAVGSANVTQSPVSAGASVPIVLKNAVPSASLWWRLTHPL